MAGEKAGEEKGRAEERAKAHAEKIETDKKLLDIGLKIEQIASATGLPVATIESLSKINYG